MHLQNRNKAAMIKATTQLRKRTWVVALAGMIAVASLAVVANAQDTAVLVRSLRHGADFRVRVQAAFAIGNTGDRSLRRPLERALRESNPAVRAAAATALGRIGDSRARTALRRARRDSSAAVRLQAERALEALAAGNSPRAPSSAPRVRTGNGSYPRTVVMPSADRIPWGRIRYVVVLGDVSDRSNFRGAAPLLSEFRTEIHRSLQLLRGVAVFDSPEAIPADARRQIARRRLPQLRLEGNLLGVERRRQRREVSVRCEINVVLLTEPGRDLRGMLQGAATGAEPPRRRGRNEQVQRLATRALSAAIRSAMSSAPTALQRAAR